MNAEGRLGWSVLLGLLGFILVTVGLALAPLDLYWHLGLEGALLLAVAFLI